MIDLAKAKMEIEDMALTLYAICRRCSSIISFYWFLYRPMLSVSTLVDFLNGAGTGRKDVFEFADETNITYNIDIELNIVDIGDVEALSRQLKMYGLDLKAEVREQELFVLSGRLK